MIPIYYKSSEGVVVNLIETPYRMLTETELLNSEWETTTTGENFPRITRLDKKLVSPKFKIRVTGSTKTEMANNLEHLESVFDRDCFLNQMGRLYIGDFYRECFITGITHGKVFEKAHTVAEYVATSNDGYWVSNKEISFSGSGALVGEIADKLYVTASHRSEYIIYTPQADHTAHLEWSDYGAGDHWLRFDLGQVTNIAEFSGITLQSTGIPISCDLQISNGETVDDSRSISVVSSIVSNKIKVDDFTEITIDSYGESSWEDTNLILYGYSGTVSNSQFVSVGDTIDVSAYNEIAFMVNYLGYEDPTTVEYTVNEQQWQTIESYSSYADPVNVEAENIECSSIRLRGNYIGNVNADLSVVSDEQSPVRNLLDLGYQTEGVDVDSGVIDDTPYFDAVLYSDIGYITFDDVNLLLKNISCDRGNSTSTVQGLVNNEWVDICLIEDNLDEDFNDHYDQIRIEVHSPALNSENLKIQVTTDAKVYNDSYAPSNAIIEISGMPNNPSVVIGGYEYGANIELSQGHKLVIDTKKKTVRDYADEDTYENVYASRMTDFTPIETGENEVAWGGNAEIKITLEQARSIPKWN